MLVLSPGEQTDADLVRLVQAGGESGRAAGDTLIHRHTPMVVAAMGKLYFHPHTNRDEVRAAGQFAIWYAATRFDLTNGAKFGTFLYVCIPRALWSCISKQQTAGVCFSQADGDDHGGREPAEVRLCDIIDASSTVDPHRYDELNQWLADLPPLERRVVKAAYGIDGEPIGWRAIATSVGLSIEQAKYVCEMATGRPPPDIKAPSHGSPATKRKRELAAVA